jgi:hypothetical protein
MITGVGSESLLRRSLLLGADDFMKKHSGPKNYWPGSKRGSDVNLTDEVGLVMHIPSNPLIDLVDRAPSKEFKETSVSQTTYAPGSGFQRLPFADFCIRL